jgi:hypothetical protein
LAAQVDGVAVAETLLAARSNVHLQGKDGRTALHLAQQQGHGGIGTLIRNAKQKETEERALELLHARHHSVEPAGRLAQTYTHSLGEGGASRSQSEEEEEDRQAAIYHGRLTAVCTLRQESAKGDDEEDADCAGGEGGGGQESAERRGVSNGGAREPPPNASARLQVYSR